MAHGKMTEEELQECRLDQLDDEDETILQGVCKDCGNGTLNNTLNRAFCFNGDEGYAGHGVLACVVCGSTHLDLISL
jgi:hypothetical protein